MKVRNSTRTYNYSSITAVVIKMQCYIFTIKDTEAEFDRRLKAKKWPFYERTIHASKLKAGDRIVFYEAGEGKHKFIGTATAEGISLTQMHISLDSIERWSKPVEIKKIYDKLKIIRNTRHYGAYLAGGIKKLAEEDYDLIVKNAK